MLTLGADTSGAVLSFTLMENSGRTIREIRSESYTGDSKDKLPDKGRMNELFFSCLESFLKKADTQPAKIDRWVSITGPGSFTGIRIGVAAISGITLGLKKEHIGLSALDAAALLSGKDELTVAASIRLNEYAVRQYNFKENKHSNIELKIIQPPQAGIVFINGKTNSEGCECLTRALLNPKVEMFFRDTAPMYVKRSEAEINFDKKSSSN